MEFTYVTLAGDLYWVKEMDVQGMTVYSPGVFINSKYKGRKKFATYVHEWLHMEFPKWTERKVGSVEEFLVDIMWPFNPLDGDDVYFAVNELCKYWPKRYRWGIAGALVIYLQKAGYCK